MSDLGTARGRVVIDPSGAVRGYAVATRADKDFHDKAARNARAYRTGGKLIAGAGAVIAGGLGVAINAAANFEERISAIGAVSDASEKDLERIRKKALQLGADTKFSAAEAAEAMEELAKSGISVEDQLNGAAEATVNLAAAGEVDLKKAAIISADAMEIFNLQGSDMERIVDLIAGAANTTSIDVEQFGQALKQSGGAAALAGFSFEDMAAGITAMAEAGVVGSDAGTSLKTMFLNLNPTTKKQKDLMKELGLITEEGANQFFDAEGNVKSLADVAGVLQDALKGMTKQQQLATLDVLFGSDAIRAAAAIAGQGEEGIRGLAEGLTETSAAEVAAERMDNFKGSLEQLKGSLETLMIQVGTPFLGFLRKIVDAFTDLVNKFGEMSPETQKVIAFTLAGLAAFLLLVGGIVLLVSAISSAVAAFAAIGAAASIIAIVGAVVIAIAALAAGLIYLYNNNETFRNAIQAAWEWISTNVVKVIQNVIMGVQAFIAALKGGGTTSDGFVGFMERMGVAVRAVGQWITGTAIPALQAFGRWILSYVVPAVQAVGRWITGTFIPGVQSLARWITSTAIPALRRFAAEVMERVGSAFRWLQANVFPIFTELGRLVVAVVGHIVRVIGAMVPTFRAAWNIIKIVVQTAISIIRTVITNAVNTITRVWDLLGKHLFSAMQIAWNLVRGLVTAALQIIRGIIQVVTGIITGDWSRVWQGIKNIFGGIWNQIMTIVRTVIAIIQLAIRSFMDIIRAVITIGMNLVRTIFQVAWTAIQAIIRIALAFIRGVISSAMNVIRGVISSVLEVIKTAWNAAWGWVRDRVSSIWAGIKSNISTRINEVKDTIGDVLETIKNTWNTVWGGIRDGLSGIWRGIMNAVRGGLNAVIGVINSFIGFISHIPGVSIPRVREIGSSAPPRQRSGASEHQGQRAMGGFLTNGPQYVVGEGKRQYPEAVIATDPRYRKQNLGYWAWAGEQLGAFKGGGIPGFAPGGIPNPIEAVGGVIRAARNRLNDFVSDIRKATLTPLYNTAKTMVDALPIPGGWGAQIKGFAKNILERMYNWAGGEADRDAAKRAQAAGDTGGTANAGQTGESGTVGNAAVAIRVFRRMFPGMTIGGRAPRSTPSDHPEGKALDLMTTSHSVANRIINTFMGMTGRKYWIWARQIASASQGWRTRRYTGPNPHTDHVHLSFFKKGGLMSYLYGGTLLEDIIGIGRSGQMYQMHAGEHVTAKKDVGKGGTTVTIGNVVIQANSYEEGREAARGFEDFLDERKILVDASIT